MNRRSFLGACLTGAPLIAIPMAVRAHDGKIEATGRTWDSTRWPSQVLEVDATEIDGRQRKYLVPTWGKKT